MRGPYIVLNIVYCSTVFKSDESLRRVINYYNFITIFLPNRTAQLYGRKSSYRRVGSLKGTYTIDAGSVRDLSSDAETAAISE